MPTAYQHRIVLLIPTSARAPTVTWWNANIDPGQGAATWSGGLNPTGNLADPVTHYWVSTAMTIGDLAKLVARLCNVAGLTAPANWQTMTRQEQFGWFQINLPVIYTNTGIAAVRDDNDGDWRRANDLLDQLGLKRRQPSIP